MKTCKTNKTNKMNREEAMQVLNAYGTPSCKAGKTNLVFARQTEESIKDIESQTDEELIDLWKGLVWMNNIYGQVSLNELQKIDLIELEIESRNIPIEPLARWFENTAIKYEQENLQ